MKTENIPAALPLNVKNMVGMRFTRLVVLSYHGQRRNNAEWTERLGFRKNTIRNRLVQGWSIESALETPDDGKRKNPPLYLDYQGERLRSSVLARRFGLPSNVVLRRIEQGWSVEDTLTKPLQK